jgi:excisionase family DNA binding protein
VHIRDSKDEMDSVLTVQNVAESLHVHPSTLYRLLKRKQLPAFKIGSEWRFNLESINRWRADAEQKPKERQRTAQTTGKPHHK